MSALCSTGFETTPSFRRTRPSSRQAVIRFFVVVLGMSLLLLLAGSILLKTASGLQPGGAAASAGTAGVDAPQAPARPWEYSIAPLPPRLPREWVWEPPVVRFDHMYRKPR